jgi:hypothetical protein
LRRDRDNPLWRAQYARVALHRLAPRGPAGYPLGASDQLAPANLPSGLDRTGRALLIELISFDLELAQALEFEPGRVLLGQLGRLSIAALNWYHAHLAELEAGWSRGHLTPTDDLLAWSGRSALHLALALLELPTPDRI